jgi:hypothetical protein
VFDDQLVNATAALIEAGAAESLAGLAVEPAIAGTLQRAAPVFRKAWWPKHQAANSARIADMQKLVDQYGPAMLGDITRAYQEPWPSGGFPIQVSAYCNWAGAYSTRGQVLVFASVDPDLAGGPGLETLFHEAMHQWDDQIFAKLRAAAARVKKAGRIPGNLTHAMIFYTAGDVARGVVPGHVTYAEGHEMWKRGPVAPFKAALDQHWKPYLDGTVTLDAALDALITATAQ